jgi:hypothetical protein
MKNMLDAIRTRILSRGSRIDPAELVNFAASQVAENFPNPKHEGCPPPEMFHDLVQQRLLPNEETRSHLLNCSECFRYYREKLARRDNVASASLSRKPFQIIPVPAAVVVFVGLLALVVVPVIGIMIWRLNRDAATQGYSITPPGSGALATPSANPGQSTLPDRTETKPVEIDLEAAVVSRGGKQPQVGSATLEATDNQVLIKLAPSSPKGPYTISLTDPFGTSVCSLLASSDDGTVLRAQLNLGGVKAGKYLLCVTRKEEVPDCVPATVIATH